MMVAMDGIYVKFSNEMRLKQITTCTWYSRSRSCRMKR